MARSKIRDIANVLVGNYIDDTIKAEDIKANAITSVKILDGSITSTKISAGAIDSAGLLADNVITTAKILDNNITSAKILDGSISSTKIAAGAIDSAGLLADNIVTSAKILNGSISSTKIAAGAIDSAGLIVDGAIATAKIADDAITGNKLANDITITNNLTINGTTSIVEAIEKATIDTRTIGTINFDALSQAVIFFNTNQTGNMKLNFRGDSINTLNSIMSTGQSMTFAAVTTQADPAYYFDSCFIDSASITPLWSGGTAISSGNTNSKDVYSFTIFKTDSATYTLLGSQTQYA